MNNRPIQFITIDNEGYCTLTPESEELISKMDSNIAVVCIAGIYRSGKSYWWNRWLGRQDGFEIGPTIASCTKGWWIWGEPVKIKNRDWQVLIIDTEGLASAFEDRNESIDMVIFCWGLLWSSLFIYNSMKNIDESAIENWALVLNFAKKIQSKFKEINNYTNNFPSFLWVLRDFALELCDAHGNQITARQYLEKAWNEEDLWNMSMSSFNKGVQEEMNKKNEIRKTWKLFFKERDCYTWVRPVNDEKKLKWIDKLPVEELRPEFLGQMNDWVKRVFDTVRPKQVQGSYMNGTMFVNWIKMYINSFNSNALPDVQTSWKIVVDQQLSGSFDKSFNHYAETMSSVDFWKMNRLEDLFKTHTDVKEICFTYLQEFSSLNIPWSICLDFYKRLETKINDFFYNTIIPKWRDISSKQCTELSKQLILEYQKNPSLNETFSCLDTVEDVWKFIEDSEWNEKKYEIMYPKVIHFFIDFLKKSVRENKTQSENEKNNLLHENKVLQTVVEKTKELLDTTRESYEKQWRDIKDENLENRIDLEAKWDEKSKVIQSIQNSNWSTVEELQNKIIELSTIIEVNKNNANAEKAKNKKKKASTADDAMLEYKLDIISSKLDNMKSIMYKTELEKAKNIMLNEMDGKYDQVQEEFRDKIKTAKRNCEKALIRLKTSKDWEIDKLKQIIKDWNDEIQDYKTQVDSQEYKISWYKEKIINYEKEKKSQTDHAELLKILALKLNSYVDELAKSKK